MKTNKGIGVKLYSLIVFVIVFILSINSFTLFQFKIYSETSTKNLQATTEYIDLVEDAREAQVQFKVQVQEWKNILLRGYNPKDFNKYYAAFSKQHEMVQAQLFELREDMVKQDIDSDIVDTLLNEHKMLYEAYSKAIKSYDTSHINSYSIIDNAVKGIDRNTNENMDALVKEIEDEIKIKIEKIVKQSYNNINHFNSKLLQLTCIGIVLIAGFAVLIILMYKDITVFINQFNRLVEDAGRGDLTVKGKISKKSELGHITEKFNELISTIGNLISEAREISKTVSSSSYEIMGATDQISKTSEEVVGNITNVAEGALKQTELAKESNDAVKSVATGLNRIAEHTVYIDELANKAMQTVKEGTIKLTQQSDKMLHTKQAVHHVTQVISELSLQSSEIGKVVEFINSITGQIKLLSLNASIEAARAGEAGRGFTVVANEIKKLAELSKESTQKISNLIIDVKMGIENAVEEVNVTQLSIDEQATSRKSIDEAFILIEQAVFEMANKIKAVTDESKDINEKAKATENFIKNIVDIIEQNAIGTEEVASITQEQTASIEEVASSMNHLVELSAHLNRAMAKFKI